MSYLAYINGNEIELADSRDIAYNKQVNDLADLDTRQSNFAHKFIVPPTAKNVRAMEGVYLTGNQSNIPYQKNEFDLIDADSGEHLIYKGWANVSLAGKKGYEVNAYDGIIDFYRRIENKSLTEIGIADLNHAKSLDNIVASWGNTMPYFYAIADYNGKNKFVTGGGTPIEINTDYQVPSARVSYIWDQIHLYAGMTYSGAYFNTNDFLIWFMTFPKPVPTLVPTVEEVTHQGSILIGDLGDFDSYNVMIHDTFTATHGEFYSNDHVKILVSGTFRLKVSGTWDSSGADGSVVWFLKRLISGVDTVVASGTINGNIDEEILIACNANDILTITRNNYGTIGAEGAVATYLDYILGYEANFEAALVDFKATDFLKEVMIRGGLTAFKDKYKDHIVYKKLDTVLANQNVDDWSDYFVSKGDEKYKIGKYAKRNNFRHKYNTENDTHNDGYITIDDENLQEDVDIIVSKIYSPELETSSMAGKFVNIYKIWEKELQEDSTIKYKDLSGRFYFLRFQNMLTTTTIASESLNTEMAVTTVPFATYTGLNFQNIIAANYPAIESILDKGKMVDGYFNLSPVVVNKYDFQKLIYVKQLASYYLVNKIVNFIKGNITKCELLEVDYKKTASSGPPENTASYIHIDSFTVDGCVITVTYSTDATIGTNINLVCEPNDFGTPPFFPPDPIFVHEEVVTNTGVTNTVSFTMEGGNYYMMSMNIEGLDIGTLYSNVVYFENTGTCEIISPSELVITNVTLLSENGLTQTYQIDFTTDAVLPRNVQVQNYKTPVPSGIFGVTFGGWSGYSDNGTATTTSINHSVSRIFGDALKLQIKIGTKESNEYTI